MVAFSRKAISTLLVVSLTLTDGPIMHARHAMDFLFFFYFQFDASMWMNGLIYDNACLFG